MTEIITPTGIERPLQKGTTLVLKMDKEGCITYADQALVDLTGFSESELIGQSPQTFRHPDVPEAVIAHVWKTLRRDRPWRGVLKYLCRNGDHYWADTTIVPLRQRGKNIGYMSVRDAASPEHIRNAEMDYAFALRRGKVQQEVGFHPMRYLSVKRGVLTGIIFVLLATAVSAWIGVRGLANTSLLVYELQRYNDVATAVTKNNQHLARAMANILLALQHAPTNRVQAQVDRLELKEHLQLIRAEMDGVVDVVGTLTERKAALESSAADTATIVPAFDVRFKENIVAIDAYSNASQQLMKAGILPLVALIEHGKLAEVQEMLVHDVGPLAIALNGKSDTLSEILFKTGIDLRRTVDDLYDRTLDTLIFWSIFTALVVGISGVLFFRGTMRPLKIAMRQMQQIAEGHLSERPAVFGSGETGKVSSTVAAMQVQLRVMLYEVHRSSDAVHGQVKSLNGELINILNNTEDMYDQSVQIEQALERSGAGAQELATVARRASSIAEELALAPIKSADRMEELLQLTAEVASYANLNVLAASEIARLSDRIMCLAADNRESSNNSWAIGQRLDSTSDNLKDVVDRFD